MVIVDSSGWLEWFTDGRLADAYQKYLADQDNLLVPTIILFNLSNTSVSPDLPHSHRDAALCFPPPSLHRRHRSRRPCIL